MAEFSIGEVEAITGIKAHVLRYWEEVIPSFAPTKNIGAGWRVYSGSDIQIILRLNYLINKKKFTIEGARNQLIREAEFSSLAATVIPELNYIRSELFDLYTMVCSHRRGKKSD